MRLQVRHISEYHYDQPVRSVVQSHRLTPTRCGNQRVEAWEVSVSGGIRGGGFRDGAGDWVQAWTVQGPLDSVRVTVEGIVETVDCAGILRDHRENIPPTAWLSETMATRADSALHDLAASAKGADALSLAHDLSLAVTRAIAYRPGATEAHTSAAEALALGEGVCQDHAQVLTTLARLRGLPARYVSGYLHATADGVPHEAAHAWAEIYLEGLGWLGFDPANACCPDDRYIRLGSGLDAREAAPIRGIARGPGAENLEVSVAVEAAQQ